MDIHFGFRPDAFLHFAYALFSLVFLGIALTWNRCDRGRGAAIALSACGVIAGLILLAHRFHIAG